MDAREQPVADWYADHPISAPHILEKLTEARGGLDGVQPQDLYLHDQDHYGGLEANAALADHVAMKPGDAVLDVCAGLCGPARWFAAERGVTVTGLDLSPNRVDGARELNALVGLQTQVTAVQGSAMAMPFAAASFDAAVSQEAFLHIPDKRQALGEVWRVLRPGGRFSFTDCVTHVRLTDKEIDTYWRGFAAQNMLSPDEYEALLDQAGFTVVGVDDLTALWGDILAKRLEMYRALNAEARLAGNPSKDDGFIPMYETYVGDVQRHRIGGARFTAEKPL